VVYGWVVPRYLRGRNGLQLVVAVLGTAVILAGFCYGLMLLFLRHLLVPIHFDLNWNYTDLQYNRFFIALIGVLAGCLIKLATGRLQAEKQLAESEQQRKASELNYLKAQVNPHFLFNSLNTLYAQLELDKGQAKDTLDRLAGLLRYQLYECGAAYIPVAKEIAYLRDYAELQRLRIDNCILNMDLSLPDGAIMIAPLLLVPFLENAFKYVSDHDTSENRIDVGLSFEGDRLHLRCQNTTDTTQVIAGGGIGIVNVRKRLELLYAGQYELSYGLSGACYRVDLKIALC
jgi:LytS/YehU family sensor histidine kinase